MIEGQKASTEEFLDIPHREKVYVVGTSGERPTAEQLEQAAKLFGEVFAGPPWYEATKCSGCMKFSGLGSRVGGRCLRCGIGVLKQAYPPRRMQKVIGGLLNTPGATLYLIDAGEIRGFAWGYPQPVTEVVGGFPKGLRRRIIQTIREITGSSLVFSLAEIGIQKEYRGRKLGKLLFLRQIKDARERNLAIIVNTRSDTHLVPLCLSAGMKQIFGPEVVLSERGVELTGKDLIGIDNKIPERVLFVGI